MSDVDEDRSPVTQSGFERAAKGREGDLLPWSLARQMRARRKHLQESRRIKSLSVMLITSRSQRLPCDPHHKQSGGGGKTLSSMTTNEEKLLSGQSSARRICDISPLTSKAVSELA